MSDRLLTHLRTLLPEQRLALAFECGTTRGHLNNLAYDLADCRSDEERGRPRKTCSPKLALALERATHGAVRRAHLRPDYREIWPDLSTGDSCQRSGSSASSLTSSMAA